MLQMSSATWLEYNLACTHSCPDQTCLLLEYKWVDENGITNRLRIHDPDPSHPGSNAANGWVARWQQKKGYYDLTKGDFAHKNDINLRVHIMILLRQIIHIYQYKLLRMS